MPIISIIIPVYNVEEFISKCIESILSQTFKNFELILVNDGSTDRCGEICDEYARKDKRIHVIHKANGGQSTARNVALDIAKGKYIGFVDGDDYIASDMYEQLYDAMVSYDADISVCGRYNVSNNKITPFFTMDTSLVMNSKETIRRLLVYDNIDSSPCDKLFSSVLFDNIRFPSGYICEDVAVVYKLIEEASKIVHTGKPLYYYLQRQGSTSKSDFSKKTMGLVIYHGQVYEYVKVKYPELVDEARYFYLSRLICANELCLDVSDMRLDIYRKELKDRLKCNMHWIFKNKYIVKKDKAIALCIYFNCYMRLKSLYKLLKSLKN